LILGKYKYLAENIKINYSILLTFLWLPEAA
jgi:hypothetical protein